MSKIELSALVGALLLGAGAAQAEAPAFCGSAEVRTCEASRCATWQGAAEFPLCVSNCRNVLKACALAKAGKARPAQATFARADRESKQLQAVIDQEMAARGKPVPVKTRRAP